MENFGRQGVRQNAELVDALFEMMFEVAQTSPTNRLRNAQAFCNFEQHSRRLVALLTSIDLASADELRLKPIIGVCEDLKVSLDELSREDLIFTEQAQKLTALVLQIQACAENALTDVAGTPNR